MFNCPLKKYLIALKIKDQECQMIIEDYLQKDCGNGKKSQEMLKIFLNTCQLDMEGLLMNLTKPGILMILFTGVFGKEENIGVKF